MASGARFSRLFDEWEHDPDITMVELGENDPPELQRAHHSPTDSSDELGRFETTGTDRDSNDLSRRRTLPSIDDTSTRSLLHRESLNVAKAAYSDNRKSSQSYLSVSGEPRQRTGIRDNIQQLWHKKSVLSARTASTFDGNFAHGKPGLWYKQMLADRSLRSMAAFTAVCAVIMLIITLSYIGDFANRLNLKTTSVGGKDGESCGSMEQKNVAVHLFINIAATMILGCSNTYQQLVTSLKVDEIRWVLSKRGDSKVGTNSPWAINHKRDGKTKAWLAWLLLISTSLPVHFLANSVIGPSFYIHMPSDITYTFNNDTTSFPYSSPDTGCWTALRANAYVLPKKTTLLNRDYNADELGNSTTYRSVNVKYAAVCESLKGTADIETALKEAVLWQGTIEKYANGNCSSGSISCLLSDPMPKQCRMNVRMQAAFILTGCLFIKAIYMIILNVRARHRTKQNCLTYGDVIVASVLDPSLKIKNECMLNSGDGWREKVEHTCHKHCKDPVPSTTGDNIGHCQKCKKFNKSDKAADLPHPSIAIKYKRSLLSNLGSTAIVQMITLMFISIIMISVSIMIAVSMSGLTSDYHSYCPPRDDRTYYEYDCTVPLSWYLKDRFGTWGGFSSSASLGALPSDSLSSEFTAFAVSNGAQFLYSLLYLLLIYNLSLISMENEWGAWEEKRRRPRCTLVRGKQFEQSYFLQLPSKVLLPLMAYAALMHWLLGQAISTTETIFTDPEHKVEHSTYFVTFAAYPIFISTILMIAMTAVCWWAFTFTREGFIPQMYGSIRACCASTAELEDFAYEGIQWGDLGMGEKFRHAGFTSDEPSKIVPAELYAGREKME
ncbi:hypothetical protein LSUB1_G001320 [Lachnellula subtilissima]|uniref:DUF6536 domain-containing protein n=1 Tax=Lachnellula subtilissima TaxID=602034 RepID=A0A8H8S0H9_9HELO|nr:hypothetical protein LSUB1_G001320 [Lachnellula subtilissima]